MTNRVFVTGAAGFVGRHLVPLLQKNGYDATALVRTQEEKKLINKGPKIIVGDLSKKGPWQSSLKNHNSVIHLAAIVSAKSPDDFRKNNVVATENLIKVAKKAKIKRIILFSSAAVNSIRKDPYSKSKEMQEKIVAKSGLDYKIIRPSMIYGPQDNKNVGWLINFVKKTPIIPLPGGGNFGRQPVYVEDICQIVLKLLKKNYAKKIFEIHGYEYVTLKRMIESIIKQLHSSRVTFNVPIPFLIIAIALGEKILPNPKFTQDQIKSLISGERFSGDLWWKTFDIIPTRFEAGIAKMIEGK